MNYQELLRELTESYLKSALAERTDGMRIDVHKVSSIPRGPNGKFKTVVRLPFESAPAGATRNGSISKALVQARDAD